MGEHTPTPWFVDLGRWTPDAPVCAFAIRSDYKAPNLPDGWRMHYIAGANISEHASFTACFTPEEIEANAAFIVKAVNSHEALVKALEFYADGTRYNGANHRLVGNDPYTPEDQVYRRDVTRDSGAFAREALAQVKP